VKYNKEFDDKENYVEPPLPRFHFLSSNVYLLCRSEVCKSFEEYANFSKSKGHELIDVKIRRTSVQLNVAVESHRYSVLAQAPLTPPLSPILSPFPLRIT
jgi:hypothetical protein